MKESLQKCQAIAVDQCGKEVEPGVFLLDERMRLHTIDGLDMCVKEREEWIWSVGVSQKDGRLYASTDSRFYQNPDYECVFLR